MPTDRKLSKSQIKKIIMSEGALGSILGRLLPGLIKVAGPMSDEGINDVVKIVKALEDADILVKGVTKTLQNDVKKGGALPILPMLLGTSGSSLIENLLSGRGMYRADK